MKNCSISEIGPTVLVSILAIVFVSICSLALAPTLNAGENMYADLGGGVTGDENTRQGMLTAEISTTISITVEGAIDWGTVPKETVDIQPSAHGDTGKDNYYIQIDDTTNVRVDLSANAENEAVNSWNADASDTGMYNATLGPDNIIAVINFYENQDVGTATAVDIGNETLQSLGSLGLTNLPVPGATSENYNVWPAINTASNQVAGSYQGTMTIRATQH